MNTKRIFLVALALAVILVPLSFAEEADGDAERVHADKAYYDGKGFVLEFSEGLNGNFKCFVMDNDLNKAVNDLMVPLNGDKKIRFIPDQGYTVTNGIYNVVMTSVNTNIAERIEVKLSVESITIDRDSVSMSVGDGVQLHAEVSPSDAADKDVKWSSSNPKVATVNEGGYVKAIAKGTAVITAEAGGVKDTCKVTVDGNNEISVTLDRDTAEILVGGSIQLNATVSPENADNKKVFWSSSSPTIANVVDGKVTGLKAGTAVITVTTEDGAKTDTCEVTVSNVPVSDVSLDKSNLDLKVGKSSKLTATVSPSNAFNKNVTWSSSDVSVAEVDSNGNVTAKKAGTATITVKTADGNKTDTCTVTVSDIHVTSVSIESDHSMTVGSSYVLHATINPGDATNKKLIWTTSDSSVVTVDQDGRIKAVSEGTATITVTSDDGNKTDTCRITVKENKKPVTGITLDKTQAEVLTGHDIQLMAVVSPTDATNKDVIWSTSDPSIASVLNGKVTGLKAGTVIITATTADGAKKATCTVSVTDPIVVQLTVSGSYETSYEVGDSFDPVGLTVTASMSDGSFKDVTSECTFSPETFTNAGVQKVTIGYMGKTVTVDVKVTASESVVTESISVSGSFKTQYAVGDSFDPTGMKATATMSDGSTKDVTSECDFSPERFNEAGKITVTVFYGGASAEVQVTVSSDSEPNVPSDGDSIDIVPIAVIAVLAIAGVVVALFFMRSKTL